MEPATENANYETPDARYEAGVAHFNRGEYFEAHEVWEDLWQDCPAADRRFYQALIQAAVAVYHFGRNNQAGAARLFHSGKRYMSAYRPSYLGLEIDPFWQAVADHIAPALGDPAAPVGPRPTIALPSAGPS